MKTNYIVALAFTAGLVSSAKAGNPITYTDWTTASSPGLTATASGTLGLSSGTVNVSYSGEFTFAQVNDAGAQYWIQPVATELPYTGNSVVGNAPTSPDIIALSEPNGVETDTITFSKPVFDPIMLINSLGQEGTGVSYLFNQSFTLLSAGDGYWGGNTTSLTQSGDTLTGREGAGAIEFSGEVSSISWQTGGQYGSESWNGFTIGAETTQPSGTVPDGGTTMTLLAIGFGALLKFRGKK